MADSLPKEEAFAYVSLIRDIFYGGNITKIRRYLGNPTEEDIAQAKENVISYGEDGMVYGRKAGEIFAYLQQFSQEPMQKLLEKEGIRMSETTRLTNEYIEITKQDIKPIRGRQKRQSIYP